MPVDVSGDESLKSHEGNAVKGVYVSVERLLDLGDGKTEWRMATSGTPGGRIPSFITDMTMPSQIASVSFSY